MERIDIICVGTLKEKHLKDLCGEYIKRLSRFCKLNIIELSESKLASVPNDAQIEAALENEAKSMLSACDSASYKIALCIEGDQVASEKFGGIIQDGAMKNGKITFFIGSSHGMSESVKSICDKRLSMSKMTFPHQLARGMLLEQIYRTYMIRTNSCYHK